MTLVGFSSTALATVLHEEVRETSFHSLDERDPRNVASSRSQNDLLPLILAREELTDLAKATMVRRSALRRAREEEALEVERLRKIREDAAEAERLRISTEEAAERARRTRIQMEMDEAEMRRVRALEQFNETERQRREMQLEDRLRQLEDQDMPPEPQKNRSCKKYCRAFKVSFGIFLSLGLIFVFYLIVASIMGESAPLDIFNLDHTEDPLLVNINKRNPGINVTLRSNMDNSKEKKKIDETKSSPDRNDDNQSGSGFDNVVVNPYDTSKAYENPSSNDRSEHGNFDDVVLSSFDPSIGGLNPGGQITRDSFGNLIIEPYDIQTKDGTVIVEYVDGSPIKNDETVSVVDLEGEIPYISGEDQALSPSNPSDIAYLPSFVASTEDRFANRNRESVLQDSDRHFGSQSINPHEIEPPATPSSSSTTFDDVIRRSDSVAGDYDYYLPPIHVDGPMQTSYEDRAVERSDVAAFSPTHLPSPVFAQSFENVPESNQRRPFKISGGVRPSSGGGGLRSDRRPSLEKLESEIIETLLNIAEKDETNRRLRVMPRVNPHRHIRRPSTRMEAPPSLRHRNPDQSRRPNHRTKRPMSRRESMRIRQAQNIPSLPSPDMITAPPSSLTQPGRYLGPRPGFRPPTAEDPLVGMETSRRVRYGNHRGPRNTKTHVPPPEFRYPKSAENIQDIISHMSAHDSPATMAFSRQKRLPEGFKVGNQDHVLSPSFRKIPDSRSKERRHTIPPPGRKIPRKSSPKNRSPFKTKIRASPNDPDGEDEVIFNDDGSVVHISNNPPPLQYGHSVEVSHEERKRPDPTQIRDYSSSYKEYHPPVYEKKPKVKPIKVMLDVYPSPNHIGYGGKPKYESKYYIEDEFDIHDRRQSIERDEFRHPDPYPSSPDRYNDDRYRSPDHRSRLAEDRAAGSDDGLQYSDDRSRFLDDASRYSNDRSRYSGDKPRYPDERSRNSEDRSRYTNQTPKHRGSYYNSHEKFSNPESRHSLDEASSYDKSRHHPSDRLPTITSSDNQHTITLHINLYDRKPDYNRFNRRMDTSASMPQPTLLASSQMRMASMEPGDVLRSSVSSSLEPRRSSVEGRIPTKVHQSSTSEPEGDAEPSDPELKQAMKELGISIDLKKRFSALDVYRALMRNTRNMRQRANFRPGGAGPIAAGLIAPKPLDEEEEASILSTVENALAQINELLPQSLRFILPTAAESEPKAAHLRGIVNKVNNENFDYTDGFEAKLDNDEQKINSTNASKLSKLINANPVSPEFSRRMGKLVSVDVHPLLVNLIDNDAEDQNSTQESEMKFSVDSSTDNPGQNSTEITSEMLGASENEKQSNDVSLNALDVNDVIINGDNFVELTTESERNENEDFSTVTFGSLDVSDDTVTLSHKISP
ncbi:uncharacterized protein LOC108665959 [Hyalella azteca]|uniref:Uncharacterized protein LOC108665959 n=1 Tax=Hyalella azteca TaxID=294128 RepID=A0A8B7N4G8_HYAAZ|nr:uncharacterized protein LOC108665959 [Hyalella azteca]